MLDEDLLTLPDHDGWRYELVEGVLVRVAGSEEVALMLDPRHVCLAGKPNEPATSVAGSLGYNNLRIDRAGKLRRRAALGRRWCRG
jgi:hypothetical protein